MTQHGVYQLRPGRSEAEEARDDSARIDALIGDVRTLIQEGRDRDLAYRADAERRDETFTKAILANTAQLSDLTAAVKGLEATTTKVVSTLGQAIDPRQSIVDMTAEEITRLESQGLVAQVRTLVHSMRNARRDSRLAVGGVSVVTVATLAKILIEVFK